MRTLQRTFDHTILLAHGSRDPRWGRPFEQLAARVAQAEPAVSLAYMELQQPGLEACIAGLGAQKVAILPLFFSAGRHLREDVPHMLEDLQRRYPAETVLLPPLGEQDAFADFLTHFVTQLVHHQTRKESTA